jgi:hypothetical protein
MVEEDEFGLPLKRGKGRPCNPEKFRGTNRKAGFRRIRGSWPEAIENMRVKDSKTVSVYFAHDEYEPQKAVAALEKESRAIKKAMNRVRNQRPEYRLRQFKITRTDTPGTKFCRIVSTTLTRIA